KLSWDEFRKLAETTVVADMHCVTTWSRLDQRWEGIPFAKIVELAKPLPEAKFVIAHSEQGFTANTPIEFCLRDDCLIALRAIGVDLQEEPAVARPEARISAAILSAHHLVQQHPGLDGIDEDVKTAPALRRAEDPVDTPVTRHGELFRIPAVASLPHLGDDPALPSVR